MKHQPAVFATDTWSVKQSRYYKDFVEFITEIAVRYVSYLFLNKQCFPELLPRLFSRLHPLERSAELKIRMEDLDFLASGACLREHVVNTRRKQLEAPNKASET